MVVDRIMFRYFSWILAGCVGVWLIYLFTQGQYLRIVGVLPFFFLMASYNAMAGSSFRAGWVGASNRYDQLLTSYLPIEDRSQLLLMLRQNPPDHWQYHERMAKLMRELSLLENPSAQDIADVYRKYGGPK